MRPKGLRGTPEARSRIWLNHSAAEALRGRAIFIITAADAFDRTSNERFHARLRELEIPHEFVVLPGAHTFDVVQEALPRIVNFVARNFTAEAFRTSQNSNPNP